MAAPLLASVYCFIVLYRIPFEMLLWLMVLRRHLTHMQRADRFCDGIWIVVVICFVDAFNMMPLYLSIKRVTPNTYIEEEPIL